MFILYIALLCTTINTDTIYKKFLYESSLVLYHGIPSTLGTNWWNKIDGYQIILGAIPLHNDDHYHSLLALKVESVLSVVENFELEDGLLNTPVKQHEWVNAGLRVKQVKAVDFMPLTNEQFGEAVSFMHQVLDIDKERVYIHCKAGKGRSASVVIAYLMEYHLMSYDDAYILVKRSRPSIDIDCYRENAILRYILSRHVCRSH